MKPCSSTIVLISVIMILFCVTVITLLSSRAMPETNDTLALSVNENE